MNRMKIAAGLLATGLALPLSQSHAHEGATGVVKERMDAMTEAGKAMKDAGEHIRSNRSVAAVRDDALAVAAVATKIGAQFPAGSDKPPTDAKPEIWVRWDDFTARAQTLERESLGLAAAVDAGDASGIARQFQVVGRACAGCHETYRFKRQ